MSKKILTLTIITLIVCSATFIQLVSSENATQPSKLSLSINPPNIPADNNAYNCVSIQLQDASGKPARAQQDTTISLSSSLIEIGTVDSTVTIKAGSTYGVATFYATFTPGTTTITATATGYATVQAAVVTVGPKPYTLGIYGFPALLPADGGSYNAIMVQLQDSTGSPAKAPIGGTQVTLSCSNTDAGDVAQSVTIAEGKTYAIATFTTTTSPETATITAIASDYGSTSTTITTQTPITINSGSLKISSGPTKVLADNIAYKQIAVEIMSGPALGTATSDITVTIASADESIGRTEAQVIIPAGQSFALATFTSTYKAGATTITAAATNFAAASYSITTTGFTASKLAVYCAPSTLPSDGGEYQAVILQLQDAQGRPAQAPANLAVGLFSSQPVIAAVSSTVTVHLGQTYTTGNITTTHASGATSITAQASNYNTGQATATTNTIDPTALDVSVTANPQTVPNGNQTQITVHVTDDSSAIAGATVQFVSNNNGSFSQTHEDQPGYYTTTFTAASFQHTTTCTITATVTKTGYENATGTAQITVVPPLTPTPSATTQPSSGNNAVISPQLRFRILDGTGNFVTGATVVSVEQPTGTNALSGVSDSNGYVSFQNMKNGSYSFQVTKDGFATLVQAIDFKGTGMAMTLALNTGSQGDNTLLYIIVAVVVAIVLVIVGIVIIKRRKPTKSNKLQPLNWPMAK